MTVPTASPARLQFVDALPSDEAIPTKAEIKAALDARPGEWAVVARADRLARAEALDERIADGREYGDGYDAAIRKAGPVFVVFARRVQA